MQAEILSSRYQPWTGFTPSVAAGSTFQRARGLQQEDLAKLLHSLSGRIVRLLERRGLLKAVVTTP